MPLCRPDAGMSQQLCQVFNGSAAAQELDGEGFPQPMCATLRNARRIEDGLKPQDELLGARFRRAPFPVPEEMAGVGARMVPQGIRHETWQLHVNVLTCLLAVGAQAVVSPQRVAP